MKRNSFLIIIFLILSVFLTSCGSRPSTSTGTRSQTARKVWMHYMPWFQAPYSTWRNQLGLPLENE